MNILPAGFERAKTLKNTVELAMEMYIAYYNKVAACCILTLVDPDNYIHTQRTADDVGILSNRTNKYPHRCKKFSIDLTMTKFGNFPCI